MGDLLTALSSASGGVSKAAGSAGLQGSGRPVQAAPLQMNTGYGLDQASGQAAPDTASLLPDLIASALMPQQGATDDSSESAPPPSGDSEQPSVNPYGIDISPQHMAQDVGSPPSEDDVAITGFRPKQETTLGHIGDFFLKGLFHRKVEKENLQRAMEGFTKDPEAVIRKVATFNPDAAWDMKQKYDQIHKDDDYRAARATAVTDQFRNTFGNMLGSITKSNDPEKTFDNLKPTLQSWLERHNLPDSLPEKWDPEWADTYRYGGYKTKDQISQESTDTNRTNVLGERVRHDTVREGQMGANVNERARHDLVTERQGQARIDKPSAKGTTEVAQTKYGPGIVKTVGKAKFLSVIKDGVQHVYTGTDGIHWQHYDSQPIKK